jgi:protein-S-isoprenylcysteine O-methyltransferase Ste14
MRLGPGAEREPAQRLVQVTTYTVSVMLVVVSGYDARLGWSAMPLGVMIFGHALLILGFWGIDGVFRANSFAHGTVEVAPGQSLVDSGPYAVVRHPMYAWAVPLVTGVPLALGSWWALALVAPMIGALVVRLLHEERFLRERLPGYAAYCARVRWRLVPGVY